MAAVKPSGTGKLFEQIQPDAARRLMLAAAETFAEKGYHATTTRDIAARAGMSPAGIYIHYPSKQDVLFQISKLGHEAALKVLTTATDPSDDPPRQLRCLVRDFAGWHAEHHTVARAVQRELDALTPEHFAEIAFIRRRIDRHVRGVLSRGVESGHFTNVRVPETALAILSLCIDVVRWYPAGRLRTHRAVSDLYADLAMRIVGADRFVESTASPNGLPSSVMTKQPTTSL